ARSQSDIDLWQMELSGKLSRSPLSSTLRDWAPRYSPDGTQVAFNSERSGQPQIWVSSADGSAARQLTSFKGERVFGTRWTPDGKRLIFLAADPKGDRAFFIIDAAGGNARRLTGCAGRDTSGVSADGEWLYFRSTQAAGNPLMKVPAGSPESKPMLVVDRGAGPLESPDGQWLFYTSGFNTGTLYRKAHDGSGDALAIAPQVRNYNYAATRDGVFYMAGSDPNPAIYYYDHATARSRKIGDVPGAADYGLTVSPDARRSCSPSAPAAPT
ncbi:MAG: DUF5050 domain-containing protein, partial [Bryobacteraceae bacterium]|nr:DUF5050 domain-containing protein [Bryobacteraceae bacterium]